jgi:hypothetical protein
MSGMKMPLLSAIALLAGAITLFGQTAEKTTLEPRCYELRTYTAVAGRLPNLHARFRNHTIKLFEKHGMKMVGFWTPVDKENTLIYVIEHASREAAKASWAGFRADPEWLAARKASEEEAGGSLTEKVESVFMSPTDYSPLR